jgi:HSP20 family molecular chaperone IbpA
MEPDSEAKKTDENVMGRYAWFTPSRSFVTEWNELSKKEGMQHGVPLHEPHSGMLDAEGEVVLRMEFPGVKKENITVHATEDRIEISVEERFEEEKKDAKEYVCKTRYNGFRGSYLTPAAIDTGAIKAKFTDGVLEIRAKKSGQDRKKKIDVE